MKWFKLHSNGILRGSISVQLTESERFVWVALLAKASESPIRGVICKARGIPYRVEELAMDFSTTIPLIQSTISKCAEDINDPGRHNGDNSPRLTIDNDGCINITNWEYYQVEK